MKRLFVLAVTALTALTAVAQERGISPQSVRVAPVPDRGLTARIWTDRNEYRVGENIRINYQVSRDAYVLIFSTDPDGKTRQLLPNAYDDDNFARGGRTHTIPNRGYQLEVTPPKGRETLSIVAFRERGRAMDAYRASSRSNPFPERSGGARAAIQRIEPRPDGDGSRYAQDSTTIRILGRNENTGGNRDARLTIESSPSGAYVYVNNQYRGISPVEIRDIRPGTYDVVLNRAGYHPVRKRVRVDHGERERIREDLQPIRYGNQGSGYGNNYGYGYGY